MCRNHRLPIQCIVPPYIISKLLSENEGSFDFFRTGVSKLTLDEQIRARRSVFTRFSKRAQQIVSKGSRQAAPPSVRREVYSAEHRESLPGMLVRAEGDPPVEDPDANNVYEAAGATWDFYYSMFGRNSIDNEGLKIIQTIHYGVEYDNAFWDGQQMIFGDGDGQIFGSFTSDPDIIGHELTHGVIQYECNLVYRDESGALNESLADVFGILIKQKVLNQMVDDSDWLIGENVLLGDQYALRSFKAPGTAYVNHPQLGTDPQPAHMDQYTDDPYDNGGVHLNSGITNHAFYLAAMEIGGYAWKKTGQIWYAALCDNTLIAENATFADFRNATIVHAGKLFPNEPHIQQAVSKAWEAVGIKNMDT